MTHGLALQGDFDVPLSHQQPHQELTGEAGPLDHACLGEPTEPRRDVDPWVIGLALKALLDQRLLVLQLSPCLQSISPSILARISAVLSQRVT